MLKKPPDFGGLTHKIRKIVFSYFRCPVFAFLVSRLNQRLGVEFAIKGEKHGDSVRHHDGRKAEHSGGGLLTKAALLLWR